MTGLVIVICALILLAILCIFAAIGLTIINEIQKLFSKKDKK